MIARAYVGLLVGFLTMISGCTTAISLTDEGTRVSHVMRGELPGGCRVIGDVPIGIPPDAAQPPTEEDLFILMRNKAGANGGTHVVVESQDTRTQPSGERYYVGRGTSYACAQEEATSGGEDGPSEAGDMEADEPEGDGEMDESTDDALEGLF